MFTYKTRAISIYDSLHNNTEKKIFIVKYDHEIPKLALPSPLTYFIYKYGSSYNTQKKLSDDLCAFINYINLNVHKGDNELFNLLKNKGLAGLTFEHLAHYLNYISNNPDTPLSLNTVLIKRNTLYRFYKFLSISGINHINDKIIEKVDLYNSQRTNTRSRSASPFDYCPDIVISYPQNAIKPNKVLKDMPQEVWELFIEYAEEHYFVIAFGLLLVICSGIRRGECVNLRVKDVKVYKQNSTLYLNIKDNQLDLFGNRDINLNNSQVKKIRKKQPVLPLHSRIVDIFENHKNFLKRIYKTEKIEDKALFVNANGLPMSGDSFSYYFRSLKSDFINFLEDEGLASLAQQMRYYTWGAHIGRHIFTNAIIKYGYVNGSGNKPISKLVAILRGDSSEESSNTYIDDFTISEAISKNINDISKLAMENAKNDN